MDLKDKLDELSSRIKRQLEHVKTEEAVKTAFVLPFLKEPLIWTPPGVSS